MAALELEGKIQNKLSIQKGQSARGAWSKQDFILEYMDGSFPASVCFTAFGDDKVAELSRYQCGDSVKVSFNLRAREYNGRWYNDLRVWRISPLGQSAQPSAPSQACAQPSYQSSAPAPAPSFQQAPAPTLDDFQDQSDSEDLPF